MHRDIKPHNVIVDGDGRVKVTDFGIARAGAEPDDRGRLDHRHRAVPLARAGARRAGRPALRPLLARGRPLRAADRHGPVHGRHAGRDRDEAPLADARAALDARGRRSRATSTSSSCARSPRTRPSATTTRRGDGRRPRARRARASASPPRRPRRRRRCSSRPDVADGADDASAAAAGRGDAPTRRAPLLRVRRAAAPAARSGPGCSALAARRRRARRRLLPLRADPGPAERDRAGGGARRRGHAGGARRRARSASGPRAERASGSRTPRSSRLRLRAGPRAGRADRARQLRHDLRLDRASRRCECPTSSARAGTTPSPRCATRACEAEVGRDQLATQPVEHGHRAGAEGRATSVVEGRRVRINVSKGPKPIAVPNVVGGRTSRRASALQGSASRSRGRTSRTTSRPASSSARTRPRARSPARRVGHAPASRWARQTSPVPDVDEPGRGRRRAPAASESGFEVAVVRRRPTTRALDGIVLAQDPPGGAERSRARRSTLFVGRFERAARRRRRRR